MAANMKAVKLRMKSIQSTMQITKAMELVASSKLRKAKERADASRPYFHTLENTLKQIAAGNTDLSSVYTKKSKSEKWCYVVIAGDRGLAGGYNSNLFKEMESQTAGKDYCVLPIGKISLYLTALRSQPYCAGHSRPVNSVMQPLAIPTLSPCFPRSRVYHPCFR